MTEYAVYQGDELLAIGTLQECAEKLKVKPNTVLFYGYPYYAKRTTEKARRTIKLEDLPW